MSALVADASIVIKWFIPENNSDAARRLLLLPHEFFAPDLLFAEIASTVWKKVRRGEIEPESGRRLVADIDRIAVETMPCRQLCGDAYAIATATGQTTYDCMYLALAIRLNTRMITADHRFLAGLASFPLLAERAAHVEEFAE